MPTKGERFHEIDLLRFLAAFGVLLFHYTFRISGPDKGIPVRFPELGSVFKYGYLGVELFFIISGFVVLLTALDRNAREFVVSRVTRLYPAYWTCVTLTSAAILLIGGGHYSIALSQYLVNLTMLQEFFHIAPIDGVYWTLTIELKFYLLVFLLVLTSQVHRLQYFLAGWLIASIFLDFQADYNVLRFFLFPGYSYFFIAGAVFLLIRLQGLNTYRIVLLVASLVGALHFAVDESRTFAGYFHSDFDPTAIVSIVSLFFALFFLIALKKTGWLNRPAFVTIGALTYPLYLLHQNIGFMIFNRASPYLPHYVLLIATAAFMLGLAYAVHRGVERRYSHNLKRLMMRALRLRSAPPRD